MKVTNIDLYKYFGWPKPNKYAKGILHGIFFDHDSDDAEFPKKRIHPIMLIIPGGGYSFVSQRESAPVCISFLKYGYNCFYLEYSVTPHNKYPTELIEGLMAITYLYKKAKDINSDKDKISLCGFSAGGHLVGLLSSLTKEERELFYPYDKCGAHIKAAIFSYPVINYEGSDEWFSNLLGKDYPAKERFDITSRLNSSFPPSYIWASEKDELVDPHLNAEYLKMALDKAKVPNKFHLYPNGMHGLSTGDINTHPVNDVNKEEFDNVTSWVEEASSFLSSIGAGLKY